jgi:hypothetical protein
MDTLIEILGYLKYKERNGDFCSREIIPIKDLVNKLIKTKVLEGNSLND